MRNLYLLFVLILVGTRLSAQQHLNTASSLKPDFSTGDYACDSSIVNLTFTGSYSPTDTIVQYEWKINGYGVSTARNPGQKELYSLNNTVSLFVRTVSGDTATIFKKIDLSNWRDLNGRVSKIFGCGDSALLTAAVTDPSHFSIKWSTGEKGNQIVVKESGYYVAYLINACDVQRAYDSIYVDLGMVKKPVIGKNAKFLYVAEPGELFTYKWYKNDTLVGTGTTIPLSLGAGTYKVVQVNDSTCVKTSDPLIFTNKLELFLEPGSNCDKTQWSYFSKIVYLPEGDEVAAATLDYGDGTTEDALYLYNSNVYQYNNHKYAAKDVGEKEVTFTVRTKLGAVASVSAKINIALPYGVDMTIHRGVQQDTIVVTPLNYDKSVYTLTWWKNGQPVPQYQGWSVLPVRDGYYYVDVSPQGCVGNTFVNYTDIARRETIVTLPAPHADSLHLFAKFLDITFSPTNIFTVRLARDNNSDNIPDDNKMITLGVVKGTDPYSLTVPLPDTLSCNAQYIVSVSASSPAYESGWSIQFTVNNQPPQPDIIRQGDSLYTTSDYQLQWYKDGVAIDGATKAGILINGTGIYQVAALKNECITFSENIDLRTNQVIPIVIAPAPNADQLYLSANFGGLKFNPDNTFTIQLTTNNTNGRVLENGAIIDLGTVSSTDPSMLSVSLPDSLACASDYRIRVVSSSPASTSEWSGYFAIVNQPVQPVIMQIGDSLFTSSAYELQWYLDDVALAGGFNTDAIRAKANGVYKVAAMNGAGCSSVSEARSVVITAVSDVTLGRNKVSAYPNPSSGPVYLKFGMPLTENVVVKVYNINGLVVYNTTTAQQQTLLDLTTLPKGFYTIEVTGKTSRKVLSIILQ